jgi:hypothetical protein
MQLGIILDQQERPRDALPLLARAEGLLEALAGPEAIGTCLAATHHARVLAKLHRPAEALPRFRRAIKVFEHTPHELISMLALAGAGAILAERDTEEEQREGQRYLSAAETLYARLTERTEQQTSK